MKTIIFTDLDDTLFFTARKQTPSADFRAGSYLRDGSISGYLSPAQWQLWTRWQQDALCIPVTARNYETFSRVALPFTNAAIINHGGTILRQDGSIDPDWQERQSKQAAKTDNWLVEQCHHLSDIAMYEKADVRYWVNHDCGLNLYVLLKSNRSDEDEVARIAAIYEQEYGDSTRGYVHCNGNNLAILPNWLGKAAAVTFLKAQFEEQFGMLLTIGAGDSYSDLSFMRQCDYWLTPTNGQIDKTLIKE